VHARLWIAVLLSVVACSKRGGTDYGKLACLDGWPAASVASPGASLSVSAGLLWQTPLVAGVWPSNPGVALVGEAVVASSGAGWAAIDRKTGAIRSRGSTGPDPSNYFLGAPAVDGAGTIYVQSAFALYAFGLDGTKRWTVYLDGPQSAEPVSGAFSPTVVGSNQVLAVSAGAEQALDLAGQKVWKTSGVGARQTVGHWGIGYDGTASVVIDLRTGKPAGRFANAAGGDVVALAPIAGRGVLAVDKNNSAGLRVLLLDTCGEQMFSVTVPGANLCFAPTVIVGQGEIAYLQVDPCGGGLSNPQVVGIDLTTGQIVTGPTALVEVPWIAGADGTLFAADLFGQRGTAQTRIVALSAQLQELWHLDVDGGLENGSAIITDDGVLFAQTTNGVIAIQTASPGLARSSWPTFRHDNQSSNWAGDQF
jgi:hypothetical protein